MVNSSRVAYAAHVTVEDHDEQGRVDGRTGIQSVEIAMRVLEALSAGGGPMGLSTLAQASEMAPSKVHRYLVSLGRAGLTSQESSSGLYDFGPAMRRLGAESLRRTNEVAVTSSHAEALRNRTGHSVNVAVWGDQGPIVVSWAYGTRPLPLTVRVGATLPLLSSSVGQIFLAYLPVSLTRELCDREMSTAPDWDDQRVLAAQDTTRQQGFTVTTGGVIPGIVSVAAPVFAAGDPLPLAVSVVLPGIESTSEHLDELTAELLDAVSAASADLGNGRNRLG